jgi:hypothetical protein
MTLFDKSVKLFTPEGLPGWRVIAKYFTGFAMGHLDITEYCQESVFEYVFYIVLSVH